MEDSESEKKWTYTRKQLLLSTRLRNEADFSAKRKKRTVLWGKVLREIKEVDDSFPFSRDDITRKFLNFMVTYKTIKKRNNTSGEAATTWEFFDEMDQVFGSRSDISVPETILDSSLVTMLSDINENNDGNEFEPVSPEPRAKRSKCEVLNFLKEEAKDDKETIKKLIDLEEKKLEVEKEKVEELRNLRIALSAIITSEKN